MLAFQRDPSQTGDRQVSYIHAELPGSTFIQISANVYKRYKDNILRKNRRLLNNVLIVTGKCWHHMDRGWTCSNQHWGPKRSRWALGKWNKCTSLYHIILSRTPERERRNGEA